MGEGDYALESTWLFWLQLIECSGSTMFGKSRDMLGPERFTTGRVGGSSTASSNGLEMLLGRDDWEVKGRAGWEGYE